MSPPCHACAPRNLLLRRAKCSSWNRFILSFFLSLLSLLLAKSLSSRPRGLVPDLFSPSTHPPCVPYSLNPQSQRARGASLSQLLLSFVGLSQFAEEDNSGRGGARPLTSAGRKEGDRSRQAGEGRRRFARPQPATIRSSFPLLGYPEFTFLRRLILAPRSPSFRINVLRRRRHVVLCGLDRDVWHRNGSNRLAFSAAAATALVRSCRTYFDSIRLLAGSCAHSSWRSLFIARMA